MSTILKKMARGNSKGATLIKKNLQSSAFKFRFSTGLRKFGLSERFCAFSFISFGLIERSGTISGSCDDEFIVFVERIGSKRCIDVDIVIDRFTVAGFIRLMFRWVDWKEILVSYSWNSFKSHHHLRMNVLEGIESLYQLVQRRRASIDIENIYQGHFETKG